MVFNVGNMVRGLGIPGLGGGSVSKKGAMEAVKGIGEKFLDPTGAIKSSLGQFDMASNVVDDLSKTLAYDDTEDTARANEYLQEMMRAYGIDPLQLEELQFSSPEYLGDYRAVLNDASMQGPSAYEGLITDPRFKENQLAQLAALEELSLDGLSAQDEADYARLQNQIGQQERGAREAILQNMAERGMSGSGNELLAQLQGSQDSLTRLSQEGLDIAGRAGDRRLAAISQAGGLAGSLRSQDFSEQEKVAAAKDAIDRFNVTNMNQNAADRANTLNQVGMANQAARQAAANQAAATANQQKMYNQGDRLKSMYDSQAQIAANKAAAAGAGVDYYKQLATAKNQAKGGLISAGIGGAASVLPMAAAASDSRMKEDTKPLGSEDIDEFLKSIVPMSYRYKDQSNGKGVHPGFMADDIEKSKIGKMIVSKDQNGMKRVDNWKLQGAMLAALAQLAEERG